jgi:N-acetylmuramoyl-L-alanine amidase
VSPSHLPQRRTDESGFADRAVGAAWGLVVLTLAGCTGPPVERPLAGRVVCVDPGHGGTAATDSYRVGPGGEREEAIDLRVAALLRVELERRGARVLMTRTEDVAVDLVRRAEIAREGRADLFLSVHHNATADAGANFPVVYFHGNASENEAGVALGRAVASRLNQELFGGRATPALVSDLAIFPGRGAAVLRHSYGIPGVISEASFFTNADEERRLRDAAYNLREARALARAAEDFLARPVPPIHEAGSRVALPPFEAFREADRMKPEALRWRDAPGEARALLQRGDPSSLARANDLLTLSARAFPDSPVAGECHRLRADVLARQGRTAEAATERRRASEHYVEMARPAE